MIIAVDFDGTLQTESLQGYYTSNIDLIMKLIEAKEKGHKLILWTCRGDEWLDEAIIWCEGWGLFFDSVNKNIPDYAYTRISCKVIADLYIDDKSPGSIDYFMKMKI